MGDFGGHSLKDNLPALRWLTPDTDEFNERRLAYCASNPAIPQAILCPRDADEVSAIVQLAVQNEIPFTVRTGGHDLHGRSFVQDALCIDMRDIDFVQVAADHKTAVIGGGVRFGKLMEHLHEYGLTTPHGAVSSIGYVGWATLGGYGCCSSNFGLGVDQILEAEVVNHRGELISADEDMLRGIRGAGGNFGIITSMKIRVYEVNNYLGGFLTLDASKGISQTFFDLVTKLQDMESQDLIPPEVVLQPLIVNHPAAGRALVMSYIWSSNDHNKGRIKLEEIIDRLPTKVLMNDVTAIAPSDWTFLFDTMIAKSVWGGSHTVSFGHPSARVLDIIGRHLEEMPSDPGTCFCLHTLSRLSPSVTDHCLAETSSFNAESRQPHTMLEIVGSAVSEGAMQRSQTWAKSLRDDLYSSGEAMKGTYIALVSPDLVGLEEIYGEILGTLKKLKAKYDPEGVFKYAVPRMLG